MAESMGAHIERLVRERLGPKGPTSCVQPRLEGEPLLACFDLDCRYCATRARVHRQVLLERERDAGAREVARLLREYEAVVAHAQRRVDEGHARAGDTETLRGIVSVRFALRTAERRIRAREPR